MPVRFTLLLIAFAVAALLAGCGGDESSADSDRALAVPWVDPDGDPPYIGSLSVNPSDGTLLMGTNTGLFKFPADGGKPAKINGQLSTSQGDGPVSEALVAKFVGPDQLVGSGHPSGDSGLPSVLGLIRSEDAGKTWESVSELGTADFHAIAQSGDVLVAPLFGQAQVFVSRDDGRNFEPRVAPMALVDLAVDPGDPKRWVATSEQGIYVSVDEGQTWRQRDPTPNVRLAWAAPDELYRIDPGGGVKVSADGGEAWEDRGSTGGEPQALTVAEDGTMYAAELRGNVHRSDDGGATWKQIVKGG
jgi:photosystem II stability/assembly factor-like uncharacterized protein